MTGHGHSHAPSARAGARHRGRLKAALVLVVAFLAVQLVAGIVVHSLALLSDAGHMATDALGLGMALAAVSLAGRQGHSRQRTFGLYRLEILAALANAVLLFAMAGYVLVEAERRFQHPEHVSSAPVFVVGLVGLAINVAAFAMLRPGAEESLNVRAAYLEVLADLLGSVGVVAGAVVMGVTGWRRVDPVIGAAIGVFILPRAWRLGREALRILVQAAPTGIDLDAMRAELAAIPGVIDVHDLHVWTLTSDMEVATAHVMIGADIDHHGVLDQARHLLASHHGIEHATLQVEPAGHTGCHDVGW
jgi:cobalt-zinc-cadmium efflux system protein